MKTVINTLICTLCITFGVIAQGEKKKFKEKSNKKAHQHIGQEQTLKEDTVDPICKMSVAKGAKQVSVYKGKQVGFCSIVCKEMFDKNPEKYTAHKH